MKYCIVLVLLILFAPLVFSQEECGDSICEVGEETTCPSDCTGLSLENETLPTNETAPTGEQVSVDTTSESDIVASEKSGFFSSLAFKIIIVLLVLIAIGIVGFVVYNKMRKGEQSLVTSPIPIKTQDGAIQPEEKVPQYDSDLNK